MKNFRDKQKKVDVEETEVTIEDVPCWSFTEELYARAAGKRGNWE